MSAPKAHIGKKTGFAAKVNCPDLTCMTAQIASKTTPAHCKAKMAQGSTAPNASGPNISKPAIPYGTKSLRGDGAEVG
jgi:hypothetical protein